MYVLIYFVSCNWVDTHWQ